MLLVEFGLPITTHKVLNNPNMKTLFTFVFIAFCSLANAADVLFERFKVFPPGMHGVSRYRIPGVVVTSRGTVIAYCEARKNSSSDWGEIEIHLRRSIDGGRSWGDTNHIAHLGNRLEINPHKAASHEQTVNNPVSIIDQVTGSIEFMYCVNYAQCYSMRSADDGLTWSKPIEITSSFEPFRAKYDWRVIATGPGHGVQIKSGRLVVPIWLAYGNVGAHKPSASATIYSDDHGESWQAGDIAVPNEGEYGDPNETMITEMSDGRVMLVSRNVSRANRKLITTSADGASNWSKPLFHNELWEPICMASIISHPTKPGTMLFSNPHTLGLDKEGREIPASKGNRENLCIKLSHDDGKSWTINKVLDPGKAAYSDLGVLPDGTILCLYEADTSIDCARFNLEWVTTP